MTIPASNIGTVSICPIVTRANKNPSCASGSRKFSTTPRATAYPVKNNPDTNPGRILIHTHRVHEK